MPRQGEMFHMQLDSHCVFDDRWDETAIRQLYATPSRKPYLTVYPVAYVIIQDADVEKGIPRIVKNPFEGDGKKLMPYICGGKIRHEGDYELIEMGSSAMIRLTSRPLPTTHYAGGISPLSFCDWSWLSIESNSYPSCRCLPLSCNFILGS